MGRRPAAPDVIVSLALAVAMQVELLLIDTGLSDSVAARAGLLAIGASIAVSRSMPVLGAALVMAGVVVLERLSDTVLGALVVPVFVALYVAYAVGAYADGRELGAGIAVLLGGSAIGVVVELARDPPALVRHRARGAGGTIALQLLGLLPQRTVQPHARAHQPP